jgi:hypothetical protein
MSQRNLKEMRNDEIGQKTGWILRFVEEEAEVPKFSVHIALNSAETIHEKISFN